MKIHIFSGKPKLCLFLGVQFLRKQVEYIWHWLSANSRHGVHSPFVYRLVDEVIYGTQTPEQTLLPESLQKQSPKVQALLLRVLQAHHSPIDFTKVPIITAQNLHTIADELAQATPNTLVVMVDIYTSPEIKNHWKKMQANAAVTATIDLFYVGLVYFREGQAKEDFKIRF